MAIDIESPGSEESDLRTALRNLLNGKDATSGNGEDITITGGDGADGEGGTITLLGGAGTGSFAGDVGYGGVVTITGGSSDELEGGAVFITGGPSGSELKGAPIFITAGAGGTGGDVVISAGSPAGEGDIGQVKIANLPAADPHIANALWNDSGTLKISAG